MPKNSTQARNNQRIKKVAGFRDRRRLLKDTIHDITLPIEERMKAQEQLDKVSPNRLSVRVRRRCNRCQRPRGVYRKFGLCRMCLRISVMLKGEVPGLRKASW